MQPLKCIGLTGGVGSGKSTVASILAEFGAAVVDADAISRQTTAAGGAAIAAIRAHFGEGALDANGAMHRSNMRELVFRDAHAKAALEAIVHPLVQAQIHVQVQEAHRQHKHVVLDLPLLVEGLRTHTPGPRLDAIWVVDCSDQTQISRVRERSAMSDAQIKAVIAAQVSREQRLAVADVVISNDGISLAQLRRLVSQHWSALLSDQRFWP